MQKLSIVEIGSNVNAFTNLETISFSNTEVGYIRIGGGASTFPKLAMLSFDGLTLTGDICIGQGGDSFALLEEITITNSSLVNIRFHNIGEDVKAIYVNNVTLEGEFYIAYTDSPSLETIVLINLTAESLI
jgi:hypothetical protein